jgi:MFS family permease
LYSVLIPLVPTLQSELNLSKAQLGLIVGMFPLGEGLAALVVGLMASRAGIKSFACGGVAMLAVTSAALGLVDGFGELLWVRLGQGLASGLCFASGLAWLVEVEPDAKRGEMIGLFSGAGAAGALLGPAVGAAAVSTDRSATFLAIGLLIGALTFAFLGLPEPPSRNRKQLAGIWPAHCSTVVLGALTLVMVPGVLLGAIVVLAPLRLDHLGLSTAEIGGIFVIAAAGGVLARPLIGRWADRCGLSRGLLGLLLVSMPLTIALPWLHSAWLLSTGVVCAIAAYGALWGPAMALASHVYDDAGVSQVLAFALMGVAGAVGIIVGSIAAGGIADLAGDTSAYALLAGMCFATVLMLGYSSRLGVRAETRRQIG